MNSKITVIPFEPAHLQLIDIKENYGHGECPLTVMNSAFTFMRGETVLAVLGAFPFVPGVIHFWALISKQVRQCPIDFHKNCLKVIAWYEQHEKPRRVQFEVRADYDMGCRWAEALGLVREGRLRGWAPDGGDCYLYSKVTQWQR